MSYKSLVFHIISTLCITDQAYIIKIIIDIMTGPRSMELYRMLLKQNTFYTLQM
jgi:hypothetical protein